MCETPAAAAMSLMVVLCMVLISFAPTASWLPEEFSLMISSFWGAFKFQIDSKLFFVALQI